jgi:hypothetical protein
MNEDCAEPGNTLPDKRCPTCGQVKPVEKFHHDRTRSDGRCFRCAPCQNASQRRYQKTPKGRELGRLRNAAYRRRNASA